MFDLPLWAALVGIQRRRLALFFDPALDLRMRNRQNRLHRILETRERFRPFDHFCLELHAFIMARNIRVRADPIDRRV